MPWPATAALHITALALPVAACTVHVLHPSGDAARLEALIPPASPAGGPAGPSSAAYVCCGALCSAPVREAGSLLAGVVEMGGAAGRMRDVSDHVSASPDAAD